MRPTLFDPISVEAQHFLLASHLPEGTLWKNAFDADDDLGKIFLGLAVEFYRFQTLEKQLFDEMDIEQANVLLTDWEKSVGIPDSCFSINASQTVRRQQVYAKFSKFGGVQTNEDFVRVGLLLGSDVEVVTGRAYESFPLRFPMSFALDNKSAAHTIIIIVLGTPIDPNDIEFPIPFPYIFGEHTPAFTSGFPLPVPIPFNRSGTSFLQCIFNALAPANVEVIILSEGEI